MNEFIRDRRARGLSPGTLKFYRTKLQLFLTYCDQKLVARIDHITEGLLRNFLLLIEENGYSSGGRHACHSTLKAFLRWRENHAKPDNWRISILKVHLQKQRNKPS
jgi:site-specific recombinase XerD